MAIIWLDGSIGSDANSGLTKALAVQTLSDAMTKAGAGGLIWAIGGTSDVIGATVTSPGTMIAPLFIVGVKSTAPATPADANRTVRGTDTLFSAAPASGNVTVGGYTVCIGIAFGPAPSNGDLVMGSNGSWQFIGCEVAWGDDLRASETSGYFRFEDCTMTMVASSEFDPQGGVIECFFCDFAGTPNNLMNAGSNEGILNVSNSDLTVFSTKTLFILTGMTLFRAKLSHCKMPATWTLASGTPDDWYSKVEAVACSNATGLGTTDTISDYQAAMAAGTILFDPGTTPTRTGGATDPEGNPFAYELIANGNSREPHVGIRAPVMRFMLEGDGTSKDIDIHIANDTASIDLTSDDIQARVSFPDSAGSAQHIEVHDNKFTYIASATALIDDTGSTWGTGANNHQIIRIPIDPDYRGKVDVDILYTRDDTTTVFLDALPVVP